MPELPEVETTVRALRPHLVGRTITHMKIMWPRHIGKPTPDEIENQIRNQRITAVGRRGKYIVLSLHTKESLIIHLRMSGHLSVVAANEPLHRHVRTIFYLDDGKELRFRDQRKFGKVYLVADTAVVLGKLGPEPLEPAFTANELQQRLANRRRAMKPLLLDQQVVAGLGNIYADEALFDAGIHPRRTADSLNQQEIERLHMAIQKVLQLGISREGASIELYTKPDGTMGDMQNAVAVFRRSGEPCYRCGTLIERIILGGRSTHFCPTCQKSGE